MNVSHCTAAMTGAVTDYLLGLRLAEEILEIG